MKRIVYLALAMMSTSEALHGQDLRSLPVDGAVIQYELAGSGPAVVLLHGWAHDLRSWHFLFPRLAGDYTAIRVNRRGFAGSTGLPDTSVDPLDVRTLLDSLGIEKAAIVGHSQGANSAFRFALAFPERTAAPLYLEAALPQD